MKITNLSVSRLRESLNGYYVESEFADPIVNYLLYGYSPGSFFTSLLANDAMGAIARSHPGNTIGALKRLTSWVVNCAPRECWGSYEAVDRWLNMPVERRRAILESYRLVYTEQQEIMMTLKGQPA